MNVLNIDIGAGTPAAAARAEATTPSAHPDAGAARARSATSPPSISLTRLAWFDANGDGRIDTRAAGAGGDATLLVPTHEVDLPTYGRVVSPFPTRSAHSHDAAAALGGRAPAPGSPAQTQRAVAAYQRYGQPDAPPASAPVPANPGSSIPGSSIPGSSIPGSSIPGSSIPGSSIPGSSIPGSSIPGSSVPGSSIPGTSPASTSSPAVPTSAVDLAGLRA